MPRACVRLLFLSPSPFNDPRAPLAKNKKKTSRLDASALSLFPSLSTRQKKNASRLDASASSPSAAALPHAASCLSVAFLPQIRFTSSRSHAGCLAAFSEGGGIGWGRQRWWGATWRPVPALAPRRPRLLRRPSSSRRRYLKQRSLASASASAPGSRGGVAGRLPRLGLSLACCDSAAARLPGAPSSRSLASIRARHSPTPVATASWSYVLRLGVRAVPVAVHVRTADRQREQRPGVRAGPASGAARSLIRAHDG